MILQQPNNLLHDVNPPDGATEYVLEDQIGYQLRLANQRHLEIFSEYIPWLTPTQFSLMAKLHESGPASQNKLGRTVGIDAATTNGVIDRLTRKQFIQSNTDSIDKRRLIISLTKKGNKAIEEAIPLARTITQTTVKALSPTDAKKLSELLKKLQKS